MLKGKVERINYFRDLGVRSMQLSYNGVSPFASGVMSPRPSQGLTDIGRHAVVTMNAAGVTVDVSHSDDKSTLSIIDQSSRPVMISHGGCDKINPHPRNKSDAILKAVADQGGVFGLYELAYLTPGLEQQNLNNYMQHLIHALNVCGEDHVGIGSDAFMLQFDTSSKAMKSWNQSIVERKEVGIAAPGEGPPPFVEELNVPERTYLIAEKLLKNGYSEMTVEKILGGNFLRVFKETWV
jgi:membrane dipeptidase